MAGRLNRSAHETLRSLWVRNFRLFFIGQGISQIGNWMTLVAQTLLVLQLTDSGVALGVLAIAQFGPILVIGPWTGLLADRSDKRRLLIVVQGVAMLQSFALAAVAFDDHPSVNMVYVVALIGGLTIAFDNPARRAFVVEMVEGDDIGNAVALNSALMTSSRIIGPALAGLAIATAGYGWAFLIDGISYIAVIVTLMMMRESELSATEVIERARGQVREGLRYVRSIPDLWVPLVMMAVIGTLSFNFQVVFPLFTKRDLGGDDQMFTILFSIVSVGSLIGALATARRHSIELRVVAVSAVGFGIAMSAMSVAPNPGAAMVIGVFVGIGSISFLTASTAIVQMRADPTMRGRVLALQAMVFLGSTPIGGPILGWISQNYGARYGIALGGVAAVATGAWGMMTQREQRPVRLSAQIAESSVEEAIDELGYSDR